MMNDLMRIFSNVQAMKARQALVEVNGKIGKHQHRLATGKRINSASEDPAGYQLARNLESRKRGLDVALQNVSNARSILNIAEGGYQNIMDILQTIKEKATQAADFALNDSQRGAIEDQVGELLNEIDNIVDDTTYNDLHLIGDSEDGGEDPFTGDFQTGEGSEDQMAVTLQQADSAALGLSGLSLATASDAQDAINTVTNAINVVASDVQDVGEYKVRINSKESTLNTQSTNTEAVRSSIEDADFAEEQMEVTKLQILQQTSVSSLVQANSAPQVVLSLFQ
ncbi:MAG: flagellin [Candidatus Marinimicrobia bacterium]|nr:flagellin [Candidatus Neomarinimicrobiota bacterium]